MVYFEIEVRPVFGNPVGGIMEIMELSFWHFGALFRGNVIHRILYGRSSVSLVQDIFFKTSKQDSTTIIDTGWM